MRIRNLDDNWDWTFGQSQLNYVKERQAIELDIQMRLKEWYKDCFFRLLKGIPWSIRLGYPKQKDLMDLDIKSTILSIEGVLNISDFESMVNNRRYRCTCKVYHQYSSSFSTITFDTNEVTI